LLDLIASQLSDDQQSELSNLLEINRERIMSPNERKRLDELMQIYGQGMVRKAEATKEAVKRGLISPLI
jgi:acetylglutamate kinase